MGHSWSRLINSLGPHGLRPLTLASFVDVYGQREGRAEFEAAQTRGDMGLHHWAKKTIFVRTGRPLAFVISTVIHEATHRIQWLTDEPHRPRVRDGSGNRLPHLEAKLKAQKEFQAHGVQRNYLLRLGLTANHPIIAPPSGRPSPYKRERDLLAATSDSKLREYVARGYPEPSSDLNQTEEVALVKRAVERLFSGKV